MHEFYEVGVSLRLGDAVEDQFDPQLVGSSLKDAGKKAFHTTEIVDAKAEVLAALEAKWNAATVYP